MTEVAGPSPYRVVLVCLGNICRSPTAEVVLRARLDDAGLTDRVQVDSCGTGTWHTGESMDGRAAAALSAAGYDPSRHRARAFDASFHDHDLILVMDAANRADVLATLPADRHERVHYFREWDPEATGPDPEVPDPWYGGPAGFATVLEMVERTADTLAADLADRVGEG